MSYMVKSIFGPTIQGEGHRAGTATMFLRFSGCNLQCVDGSKFVSDKLHGPTLKGNEIDVGFFCDTDFNGGSRMEATEIVARLLNVRGGKGTGVKNVVISGGEPTLQLDRLLIESLSSAGFYVAIETNGTRDESDCPALRRCDWISCSPKGETKLKRVDEVRCVIAHGQVPDRHGLTGRRRVGHDDHRPPHLFVSPAWRALSVAEVAARGGTVTDQFPPPGNLSWALKWVLENPEWRLSLQQHKLWGVE